MLANEGVLSTASSITYGMWLLPALVCICCDSKFENHRRGDAKALRSVIIFASTSMGSKCACAAFSATVEMDRGRLGRYDNFVHQYTNVGDFM